MNVKKAELMVFKHQRKKMASLIKSKLSRKRNYPCKSGKYTGIKTDRNLNCKQHIPGSAIRLNIADALYLQLEFFLFIQVLHILTENLKSPGTIYFGVAGNQPAKIYSKVN